MLSKLFGTDSFMEMLGTPTFWYTIVILIGIISLLIACIRYWSQGGKWVIVGIFCIGYSALTIYSGININAYYSAKGGIRGAITGIFQTNEIDYVNTAEYKISNTELIQVGETDTYSATIIMDEVFALDKDVDYMVYVNNMPCTYVENARDYVLADYKYTFYDDNFNAILTDTLNFRFAFYTNSTTLKISTNGGAEALKYWHHYFNKNTFVVKLAEVDSLEDFDVSIGSGDISNYCTVSYSVDGEIINIQVYQKGRKINLIDIENENYNVWTLNEEKVTKDYIITEDIILIASFSSEEFNESSPLIGTWYDRDISTGEIEEIIVINPDGSAYIEKGSHLGDYELELQSITSYEAVYRIKNGVGTMTFTYYENIKDIYASIYKAGFGPVEGIYIVESWSSGRYITAATRSTREV